MDHADTIRSATPTALHSPPKSSRRTWRALATESDSVALIDMTPRTTEEVTTTDVAIAPALAVRTSIDGAIALVLLVANEMLIRTEKVLLHC